MKTPRRLKPSEIAAKTRRLCDDHRASVEAATRREEAKQIHINRQNLREIVRNYSPY